MIARIGFGGLALSALVIVPSPASAEEPTLEDDPKVPLTVDLPEGSVRLENPSFNTSCTAPCVLQLPVGLYKAITPTVTQDVYVERGGGIMRVEPGSPNAARTGMIMLIAGAVVVVAAFVVPLIVCQRPDPVPLDAMGHYYYGPNPCRDISDPVKIAWIAGGGIGLTVATIGGFTWKLAGPRLALSF